MQGNNLFWNKLGNIQAKKGGLIPSPPSPWLLFKGKAQHFLSKGTRSSWVEELPMGRRKRGWWVTEDPKGQHAPPDRLPREERCSPAQRQSTRSWATSTECWQGSLGIYPVSFAFSPRSHWQPSAAKAIWQSSFLIGLWLRKANCNFSVSESRNHRTWLKQHRIARKHFLNNLYLIQCALVSCFDQNSLKILSNYLLF